MCNEARGRRGWDSIASRHIGVGWGDGFSSDAKVLRHPTFTISELWDSVSIIVSGIGEGYSGDVVWIAMVGAVGIESRCGTNWSSGSITKRTSHVLHTENTEKVIWIFMSKSSKDKPFSINARRNLWISLHAKVNWLNKISSGWIGL